MEIIEKLNECPFCGWTPIVVRLSADNSEWAVHCKNCWNGQMSYKTKEEAIKAYNNGEDDC